MTLVWKTRNGALLQTEVGTIDVVNTFSAARSVYGWMGGMDGLRFLLQRIMNPLSQRLKALELDRDLRLMPLHAHILTSYGHLVGSLDDAQESFGGDIRTQVIGTTICALAHEYDPLTAVRLFCRYLLPYLFGEANPLLDLLQFQLTENSTLQRMINEGAARGLNNMFIDTAAALGIPEANSAWGPTKRGERDLDYGFTGPVGMIGGLLRWVTREGDSEYRTRSSAVARIAAYLKVVGYTIGDIQSWNGNGTPPVSMGTKSVILVLGGSSETDPFMEQIENAVDPRPLLHYQHKTTGAMLLTALGHVSDILPETLQEDFDQVCEYLEEVLTVEYTCRKGMIYAEYRWRDIDKKATPMALRLASVYFSHLAEQVAPCFDRIARQKYLNCVKGRSKKVMQPDEIRLGRFRATAASVAISIISRFAPGTFKKTHHVTKLCLSKPGWLSTVCGVLDLDDSFPMPKVVTLLASVHAGVSAAHESSGIPAASTEIIAWRQSIYSVVPSLLVEMKVSPEDFQLVCLDRFWANVKTEADGSIKSSNTVDVQRYEIVLDQLFSNKELSSRERLAEPCLGSPDISAPDSPLYLSLSAPLHYGDPHLCFMGWFQGSVAGTVGIMDVLKALLLSRVEPKVCPGHDGRPLEVVNVKTSTWEQEPQSKPCHREHSVFIPVGGDHCWTMFAAGQTVNQGGRIVFRCPECAEENYTRQQSAGEFPADSRPLCLVGFCELELSDEAPDPRI